MTPDEMELSKEGLKESVKQMFAPVQDIVRQVSGPAATEIGLMLGDALRVWRLKRTVQLLEDVKQISSNAGLTLNPVAPRLLFPILDAATMEDDEDLHKRWVALLTNAARVDFVGDVLPAFPDVLKQLTSEEAQFLDRAYDEATYGAEKRAADIRAANPDFRGEVNFLGISGRIISSVRPLLIENLERLMLVTRTLVPLSLDDKIVNVMPPANHLYISEFGKAFVRACRLPR